MPDELFTQISAPMQEPTVRTAPASSPQVLPSSPQVLPEHSPIPIPTAVVKVKDKNNVPAPQSAHRVRGVASWYCSVGKPICHYAYPPGSFVAAACGKLRAAMGPHWRGKYVSVVASESGRHVSVKLVDWCGSTTKLIDLYYAPMQKLGGTGVLPVFVMW